MANRSPAKSTGSAFGIITFRMICPRLAPSLGRPHEGGVGAA
jgi:hypothetical protein